MVRAINYFCFFTIHSIATSVLRTAFKYSEGAMMVNKVSMMNIFLCFNLGCKSSFKIRMWISTSSKVKFSRPYLNKEVMNGGTKAPKYA